MNKRDKQEILQNIIKIIQIAEDYMTPLNYQKYKERLIEFLENSIEVKFK